MPLARIAIALTALALLAPPALGKGTANLDKSMTPAASLKKLEWVRAKVRTLASQGKKPVVVFDVDDTLVRVFTKKAVPGAAAYVNGLLADGAKLIYQTGRKESQRAKTTQQLTALGIPINDQAELWLKGQKEKASTVEWKKSQKAQIKAQGFPVGFFDNEKVNARMFKAEFPKSCVVRLKTQAYYPDPGGNGTIYVIDNFCPTN
jgi:predicted HAD superfamily phosphohydrolase YqeG